MGRLLSSHSGGTRSVAGDRSQPEASRQWGFGSSRHGPHSPAPIGQTRKKLSSGGLGRVLARAPAAGHERAAASVGAVDTPAKPLAGRRIWFVGIGGAGLSAYAQLARAWGAEVGGWDRVSTPYLAHLDGVDVTIGPEPEAPPGWEV